MELSENSHLDWLIAESAGFNVYHPSEKVRICLGSERKNLANDWAKVLILPEVPSKKFLQPPAGITMQPNPLGN